MFNLGEISMKKTLVAIAALAAASAFAQSTATIGGEVRFGYQKGVDRTATTKATTGMALTDATIFVSATEDLGGGLVASARVQLDQASSSFGNALNRRNTSLGLRGGFGTIGFSNTRSGDLITRAFVAPSNLPEGLYNTSGVVARVPIDIVQYTSPSMSGLTFNVALVEHTSDGTIVPTRRVTVLGGDYANGPLAAGVAYKASSAANGGAAIVAPAKKGNFEAYATYDLGVARVGFGFDSKATSDSSNAGKNAFALGIAAPFGPATVGLNYAKRGTAKVTEVAANYALSKRTSLNASFGNQTATAQTLAGVTPKQSQYRLSMSHTF